MKKKILFGILGNVLLLMLFFTAYCQQPALVNEPAPGVKKISIGKLDQFTPYGFCDEAPMTAAMKQLPDAKLPFDLKDIRISITDRGVLVEVPLSDTEQLYGFGLQIGSFNQRGLRKKPVVNDNPLNDVGYTHAPMPFYVSNKGYGILINTARYTTFYCGTTEKLNSEQKNINKDENGNSVAELYKNDDKAGSNVAVDIPGAAGIEVYIFEGPELLNVLQRYNLFSGGGALPAMWGLGVKYRVKADFSQQQVTQMASYFRTNKIPVDVLGLEPKWQTAAYSCSYVWNKALFPSPDLLIDSMRSHGFHINLWEHAFVSPKSPLYEPLKTKASDYLVWNGLVPDFADPSASKIFGDYHKETFIKQGISGFKMDECDNSDLTRGNATWSFPEHSRFPSGINGEQMHQVFGIVYQKAIYKIYKELNKRTFLDVRASNAFASSYPAALYSDTYNHDEYIRMIVNSGFSGLIWSPEVRESNSVNDLMRRSQTAVLSAQTLYSSWYLRNPPWLQINREKNNRNDLMPDAKQVEANVRTLLNFRMSLVPYLYNAFADYRFKGIPPFRALVVDYPQDKNTYDISDEYLIGQGILAAPLTEKADERKVYLPAGVWYNFNNNEKYEGGKEYTIKTSVTELPIFVKAGTILPLAEPVEYIAPDTRFQITCMVYGANAVNTTLFEDDGTSFNYQKGAFNAVSLSYRNNKGNVKREGDFKQSRYHVNKWKVIL
jgi:alpha-D-xyloside xylohydrolase